MVQLPVGKDAVASLDDGHVVELRMGQQEVAGVHVTAAGWVDPGTAGLADCLLST